MNNGLTGGFARSRHVRGKLRFADVFAGLGGFHVGMSHLGHECVFAAELDPELQELYELNFGIKPAGDIRKVRAEQIPSHDVLCAGFPCQPFSLAGKKSGSECPEAGQLIDDVFRIAAHHNPKYVLLENVPNILAIADGTFWRRIQHGFLNLGYRVEHRIMSPHEFGLPQKRSRIFVVAYRDTADFQWPKQQTVDRKGIEHILQSTQAPARPLERQKLELLEHWALLIPRIRTLTSHTILAEEFGATYPLKGFKDKRHSIWKNYLGAYGQPLEDCKTWSAVLSTLPSYVDPISGATPDWMRNSPTWSRKIYAEDKAFLDTWKQVLLDTHNSWQKLEWRGHAGSRDLWQHTIQFRASGIRVMKRDFAPSLVAMTTTQTPIIGPERRYLSIAEAAALQSLDGLKHLPSHAPKAFKALGNAVNAYIVLELAKRLER